MSGWKGGGALLVLAIPLVLYMAWHVKGVARPDMVLSSPPPDRGANKDQLTQAKAKTAAWAGDVRKAAWVTQQYRGKEPGDATTHAPAGEMVDAAATRSAYLNDLDQFLSGVKKPDYKSKMSASFDDWGKGMKETDEARRAVAEWLVTPVLLNSAADAGARMGDLKGLVAAYDNTAFARRDLSAVWLVRGRLKVIEQLAARADKEYPDALKVSLPLKPGDNALKSALATFVALKTQADALTGDEEKAAESKADLSPLRNDSDRLKAVAAKAVGREKLLALFAQEKLFADPTAATAWLTDVNALYTGATADDKRQIRRKVQEFCEAFLPEVARLDDGVLINGKSVPREKVQIKYRKDGTYEKAPLSADPAGLNEFTAAKNFPKASTFVLSPSEDFLDALEPTELSKAAVFYNEARAAVPPGVGGLKWTAETVENLKNKCEERKNLVDKLKPLLKKDSPLPDREAKLFARLESVLAGLRANADLVAVAP